MSEISATMVPVENDGFSARSLVKSFRSDSGDVYSSIQATDFESKKSIVNAMMNAEDIRDNLNVVINLKDFVIQAIQVTDSNTGEMVDAARIVLIDADGKAFGCVSTGIARALQNIVGVVGEPSTWPEPIPVKVVEVQSKNSKTNRFYTLVIS